MPIYEYNCTNCNNHFEVLLSFDKADELVVCPKCDHAARKIISTFASFSKDAGGVSIPIGGSSSCDSCSSSSCST